MAVKESRWTLHNYLVTSGTIFILMFLVHIARLFLDGLWIILDPFFAVATLITIGMSIWSCLLLKHQRRQAETNDS